MLEITVHEIHGHCRVHKLGDKVTIEGPSIVLRATDALCSYALPRMLQFAHVLEYNWCPRKLGLTNEHDPKHVYFQCMEPGKSRGAGGKVIFRAKKPEAKTP